MKNTGKRALGAAGSVLLLSSLGTGSAMALVGEAPSDAPAVQDASAQNGQSARMSVSEVQGRFSYQQGVVAPIATIADSIGKASKYLCGAQGHPAANVGIDASRLQEIRVEGAVSTPCTLSVEELIDEASQKLVLGCSCAANPVDGSASVDAEVRGVSVVTLLAHAQPTAGANTIVFASADGYEVALPLNYVAQRYCPIVFEVNGAPLAESVGGTNQLWLGATSARYFARDIVSITLEERETPPPAPGSDEAGDSSANLPNIGVSFGGEAV